MKKLDLHGETADVSRILIKEFLNDMAYIGETEVAIIHGNGEILKKEVLNMLKSSKLVEDFRINIYNSGETLIKLDINQVEDYNNKKKTQKAVRK